MSGTEDKVVEMHFNNAEFQKNTADTLKSLDLLKQSLNFDASTKGLNDLTDAGNKFNMGHMGTTIEGVSGKFLAMSTIAITAISNITSKAIDAGSRLVSAFAVEPITAGFSEYETKIGSIQTILANTSRYGTKLPEVEKNLSVLNDYADKTIYSFGEMTKNIGLFTNAGIKVGDATSMIKGFSNVAAASGTNAEGAASAAYQLSQALSAGQIRLMDWRSLTNVGMGNKNMQDSLIKIAKGMGVFNETGDDATEVAKDFNASLESGWLKADVMSTYLKIMAGDMSDTEQKAKGLTAAQIKGFKSQQVTAEEAATKVRTFTQLVGTIKESVGSGWADTFTLILGNFEGATTVFTKINTAVGKFVGKFSDARNDLLKGWNKAGGRDIFIKSLENAMKGLGTIIKPIKEAFRQIFPPATVETLMKLTRSFANFASHIAITTETMSTMKRIFAGVFATLEIVWTIVKELVGTFKSLFSSLGKGIAPGVFDWLANLGDKMVELNKKLVEGGGIKKFFDNLETSIRKPFKALDEFKDKVIEFLKGFGDDKDAEDGVNRVTGRVQNLADVGKKALDIFKDLFSGIKDVAAKAWGYISGFFSTIGEAISAAFGPGTFDNAIDALNVGLLGGILLMLRKFLKGGLKLDFSGGLFERLDGIFKQLTGTLKAMQQQIKSKALLNIAIAMGVLTASLLVLSLIDSADLAKALTAVAVGFGELVGTLSLLDKIGGNGKSGAGKLGLLVASMIALAAGALILSGAIALLAHLDPADLATGVAGLTASLGVFVGAMTLMGEKAGKSLGASVAIFAMAKAMERLAGVVGLFAKMTWQEISVGLAAAAASLGLLVGALRLLDQGALAGLGMALAGGGVLLLATALVAVAGAVKLFGTMNNRDLAAGLIAVSVALGAIAISMNLMPVTLPIIAAGVFILGLALASIVGVVAILGHMDIKTLAVGIGALGAMLLVLGLGMIFMEAALPGALATFVIAAALAALTKVIETLGSMDLKILAIGLGAIAAVLAVLGIAAALLTPVIPAMFALGIALGTIGIAFALFGVGAYLAAKAFEVVAKAGKAGIGVIIEAILEFIHAIPQFVGALLEAVTSSYSEFLKIGSDLVDLARKFLGKLLDTVIELAPKIGKAIFAIISVALNLIRGKIPDIIETGFVILTAFLQGLKDHIDDLTGVVIDIVIKFVQTFADNAQKIADAGVNLLLSFLAGITNRINDISRMGVSILIALVDGMAGNVVSIINAAAKIISELVKALVGGFGSIAKAGTDAIVQFIEGLNRNVNDVISAGASLILNILQGISDNINKVVDKGAQIIIDFLNEMATTIRKRAPEIQKAFFNLAGAIIDGLTLGLAEKARHAAGPIGKVFGTVISVAGETFESRSPSKVFERMGRGLFEGLGIGVEKDKTAQKSVVAQAEAVIRAFQETLGQIPDSLEGMDELSPVITPVLDLTKVQAGAKGLGKLMSVSSIAPTVSLDNARVISSSTEAAATAPQEPVETAPKEVSFTQNNYSPKALSTVDIYRNTKSQLVVAKEELDIS